MRDGKGEGGRDGPAHSYGGVYCHYKNVPSINSKLSIGNLGGILVVLPILCAVFISELLSLLQRVVVLEGSTASKPLRMYDALQHRDDRRKMLAACRKCKYCRRHGDQLEQVPPAVDNPCLHLPRSHASTALAPPRFKTPPTVEQSKLPSAAWCPARIPRPALCV